MPQPTLHGLWTAQQLDNTVDHVATELKQAASSVLCFDRSFLGTTVRIHRATHHEDFTQPTVTRRLDRSNYSLMPAPEIASLQQQLLAPGFLNEFAEWRPLVARRFL